MVHLPEIFWPKVIWLNEPIWGPNKRPKILSILVSNLPRYSTLCAFCVFSVYVQIHSKYSRYMNSFIPFSLSEEIQSAYPANTHNKIPFKDLPHAKLILSKWTDTFRTFSVIGGHLLWYPWSAISDWAWYRNFRYRTEESGVQHYIGYRNKLLSDIWYLTSKYS